MKTTMFAVLSAWVLLTPGTVSGGKPTTVVEGLITFEDHLADGTTCRLRSDGLGPYSGRTSIFVNGLFVSEKGRSLYVDLSDCVSETGVPPFRGDYARIENIVIVVSRGMLPGQTTRSGLQLIFAGEDKKTSWVLQCFTQDINTCYVTAYDLVGDDGVADRWVVVSTADMVGTLRKQGRTPEDSGVVGEYRFPFTLTFDAN